jgi:hypothetical protein
MSGVVRRVEFPELPATAIREMQAAVERLSPAEIVGLLASMPLVQQTHDMLRTIALRAAERRLLEHAVAQADARYGGH